MHLSTQEKWEIIFLSKHRKGPHLNNIQIAKEVNCTRKMVRYWLKIYEETGDVEEKKSPGRPRLTTPKEDKKIITLHHHKPKLSTPKLQQQYKKKKIEVS